MGPLRLQLDVLSIFTQKKTRQQTICDRSDRRFAEKGVYVFRLHTASSGLMEARSLFERFQDRKPLNFEGQPTLQLRRRCR